MNREVFEKQPCNQSSQYKNMDNILLQKEAITGLALFTVSKDEWNTKEATAKSTKSALYILRDAKRHQSNVEQ